MASPAIAFAFSRLLGAWRSLPFAESGWWWWSLRFGSLIAMAGVNERITIRGDSVAVEVREGSRVTRHELNRCWAQVVCEAEGARLALRSHGRDLEVGRHMRDEQRAEMARELKRELKR